MGDASEYFFHSALNLVDNSIELNQFTANVINDVKDGLHW